MEEIIDKTVYMKIFFTPAMKNYLNDVLTLANLCDYLGISTTATGAEMIKVLRRENCRSSGR